MSGLLEACAQAGLSLEQVKKAMAAIGYGKVALHELDLALAAPLGAPAGAITTYIEVPFKLGECSAPRWSDPCRAGVQVVDGAGRGKDRP